MKEQKSKGILLSYLNTALGMCFNLILIPLLIAKLSDEQYSIYKVMQSFTGPLIMFNLGMSTVVARSIARFQGNPTEENRREKEKTLALVILISLGAAILVCTLGVGMDLLIPAVFRTSYTAEQLALARKLLGIFVATTALHLVSDTFRGCVQGREQFVFLYGANTVQFLLRFGTILLLVYFADLNAVQLALVDLFLYAGLLAANVLYSFWVLRERPRLYKPRKGELLNIASFSAAILLQVIVSQVNNNMDNVILGAMVMDKQVITMYSSALSIFTIYNSLLSVFTGVYFPKAARLIAVDTDPEKMTDFVIAPGRIQAMFALAVLGAFGLFGGNFIRIWIGEKYLAAWPVAFALMVPATIPLVQNVCLSILDANLKRMFRSATLFGMALINVVVSVILVGQVGYWGAAMGTVLSFLVGHGLLMNLYYRRALKLNVKRMFCEIFSGILPVGLASCLLCLPLAIWLADTVWLFLLKCTVFAVVYACLLYRFGMRENERKLLCEKLIHKKHEE